MDRIIAVLLSSFNGEKYIAAQIESILKQKNIPDLTIIIRDDGSTDHTVDIIKRIIQTHDNIILIEGCNIGLTASYFELLSYAVDYGFKYYALSDQDDYWLPCKLSTAVNTLQQFEDAHMYSSCSILVDETLKSQGTYTQTRRRDITFYNSAIQNICPGHNQVINHKLACKVLEFTRDYSRIYSHDLWITNVAAVVGKISFDNNPQNLYRQHSGNQLQYGKGRAAWINNHIIRLRNKESNNISKQLDWFITCYHQFLSEEQKKEIRIFFDNQDSIGRRIKYASRSKLYRQRKIETIVFKILYILGFYNKTSE